MTLALAAPAQATDGPREQGSAVNQYAEVIPGADGPTVPGVSNQTSAATEALLKELATSPTYGAPTLSASASGAEPQPTRGESDSTDVSLDATLRSTVVAIESVSQTRLLGLLAMLLLTTLAGVLLATRRARRALG